MTRSSSLHRDKMPRHMSCPTTEGKACYGAAQNMFVGFMGNREKGGWKACHIKAKLAWGQGSPPPCPSSSLPSSLLSPSPCHAPQNKTSLPACLGSKQQRQKSMRRRRGGEGEAGGRERRREGQEAGQKERDRIIVHIHATAMHIEYTSAACCCVCRFLSHAQVPPPMGRRQESVVA